MTSIRGRLTVATVALVALGLIIANGATYALLRSSLLQRVDQQLLEARPAAVRALFDETVGRRGPLPTEGEGAALPSAVAELLDLDGNVVTSVYFGFEGSQPAPRLHRRLPGSRGYRGRPAVFFTTGSYQHGKDLRYRVLAFQAGPRGGTVVLALPLHDVETTLRRLLLLEAAVSAVVLAAVGAFALWSVKAGLRPLEEMAVVADSIAAGDLSHRVESRDADSEVGRLGSALNSMLERIEESFSEKERSEERLRRFVADASHELRTPLTSIRGYAELFRRGADQNPDDLAKSMRRIEEESQRMGKLVDELLLLARLDQGRPLERTPVNLAKIVEEAVGDVLILDNSHPINLDSHDSITLVGDEARLKQVALNLLSNALIHTPSGTPVHVVLEAVANDEVRLQVTDEGPGLGLDNPQVVFDRFFRGDTSRSRETGGVGLGLSIVASIVEAHGGRVEVTSPPAGGTTFSVYLPKGEPLPGA